MRDFVERHGEARFSEAGEAKECRDRAGWWRTAEDGSREWLFTSGGLAEALRGLDRDRAVARLVEAGAIAAPPGPPAGKPEVVYWDRDLAAFGLRVYASGRRSWISRYRGGPRQRFATLGSPAELTASEARRRAQSLLAETRLGRDPAAEKARARERAAVTFGAVAAAFLEERAGELRPATLREYRRRLMVYAAGWHRLPAAELDRGTIARFVAALARDRGATTAARTHATLSALFGWAIRRGLVELDANPAALAWRPPPAPARDRVLALDELAAIWLAADPSTDCGAIVRLLILTGARRDEVAGMEWRELDFARRTWLLPASRSKNRRPHLVPLSGPALAILSARPRWHRREHVFGCGAGGFSSFSCARARLDAAAAELYGRPLERWVIHDLRRSVVTHLAELGVSPHVVEAIVNHASGHKASVAGVYNHAAYEPEKRPALDRWAATILEAAGETGPALANVVALAADNR